MDKIQSGDQGGQKKQAKAPVQKEEADVEVWVVIAAAKEESQAQSSKQYSKELERRSPRRRAP